MVPDFRPYGRPARRRTLPAGTYWIPMAQPQKHWIQSMLNENTYLPTIYTFSLSGWSNPLLFNLEGGLSGERLHPDASTVPPMADPGPPDLPANLPRIGLFRMSKGTYSAESWGAMRWLLETRWELPYTQLDPADIVDGALEDIDLLVASGAGSSKGLDAVEATAGVRNLVDWVNGGGRYVGFRGGGARLAALTGLSTANAALPGRRRAGEPAACPPLAGQPARGGRRQVRLGAVRRRPRREAATDPADVPIAYPELDSDDWFVSGYADDPRSVAGTAVCVDQRAGDGRVVIFPSDPNRRGMPEGMHRVLWNAMFGPNRLHDRGLPAPAIGSAERVQRRGLGAPRRPRAAAVRGAAAVLRAERRRGRGVPGGRRLRRRAPVVRRGTVDPHPGRQSGRAHRRGAPVRDRDDVAARAGPASRSSASAVPDRSDPGRRHPLR